MHMPGIFPLLFIIVVFVPLMVALYKIFRKAGYSGWLCLLMLVPVVNLVTIIWLGFSDWPALRRT